MTSLGIATYVGTAERWDHGERPGMRMPRGMPWHGIVRSGGMRQQHRPSFGCATSAALTAPTVAATSLHAAVKRAWLS